MKNFNGIKLSSVLLFGAVLSGCSISQSLESVSDIVSSPFTSSSEMFSSNTAIERDISNYSSVIASNDIQDSATIYKGISDIAQLHGISHWQRYDSVWMGIGKGIERAQLNEEDKLSVAKRFANDDPKKLSMIVNQFSIN